ncbi:non-ribosomal peptide synthetase, partial [Rhizobium rhizogenes]
APEATAVIYEDQSFSYDDLNARANQLAHHLIDLGVKPGDYVATLLERSPALVMAELAILKAGGIYVPLDPQIPSARQAWIMADCGARLLLSHAAHETSLNDTETLVVEPFLAGGARAADPTLPLSSESPAYVMYTSGSTGMPKGVLVPHRAINRLVINNGYATFDASDRIAFAANQTFDASTLEVWWPLLNGGSLVIVDRHALLKPSILQEIIRHNGINILWMTSSLFKKIGNDISSIFPILKILIVGGESIDISFARKILRNSPPQKFINGYGPTEATTFALTYTINDIPTNFLTIPIGRPISNTSIYLLDGYGQPVPLGVAGELYIGGAGV